MFRIARSFRRPQTARPAVEQLEDRSLPATTITGAVTEYVVPSGGSPAFISRGPAGDNELWFTDGHNNRVGRIRSDGVFDAWFNLPTANAHPGDITAGPDGNMWFLEQGVGLIARMTPDGRVTGEFPIRDRYVGLGDRITAGPDGALWFTESSGVFTTYVGRITPDGQITQFTLPGDSRGHTPNDLVAGPDGALWLTEPAADEVVRLDTASGAVQEFTTGITPHAHPRNIAVGPDGALWFTEHGLDMIGRISTDGAVTEFGNVRPGSDLDAITAGPDGALWFTEDGSHVTHQVGRVTTAGTVTEYAVPTGGHAEYAIAAGRDGNVWFTESDASRIGKVDVDRALPRVAFSAAGYTVNENAGAATITVVRTGSRDGRVSVHYSTEDETARAGVDYAPASGELVFAPGETSKTFTVSIMDNNRIDGNRAVNLHLDGPADANLGPQAAAVLTIADNERPARTLAWGSKVSEAFRQKVVRIADHLGVDPNYLMAAMYFESKLDPHESNRRSGATGLIQFMPGKGGSARRLGTTTAALRRMSGERQLDFVEAYFRPYAGRLHTLGDVYMTILWPAAVGKSDSAVLFSKFSKSKQIRLSYRQNSGLDRGPRDGKVTKGEATAVVRQLLRQGLRPGNAAPV